MNPIVVGDDNDANLLEDVVDIDALLKVVISDDIDIDEHVVKDMVVICVSGRC